MSIPYHTRQAQFAMGNLVINPSFENGRRETGKSEAARPSKLSGPGPMKGMKPKGLSVTIYLLSREIMILLLTSG